MFSLRKIKELKGYRFFQDYKWDENACKLFDKNNLIYGWNGSGKTTLCDFFKDLQNGSLSADGAACSLMFENTESHTVSYITQDRLDSIPYAFKVFHQDYIQENISKDNVKHIFTVGKDQADKIVKIKQLQATLEQHIATFKILSEGYKTLLDDFDHFKSAKAKAIKEAACYTNAYNKNTYCTNHKNLPSKNILSEAEYQTALTAVRAQPRSRLPVYQYSFIQSSVREYVSTILCQTPVNNTIEALQKDAALSSWVEQGFILHENKGSKKCLFCGGEIPSSRFEELRRHFNKSYKELSDKIDKAIALLYEKHKQFESAKHNLPNEGLLYPEFQQKYQQYLLQASELCDHYMVVILGIIDILKQKKADMINEALTAEFITLVDQLPFDYSIFEKINTLLTEHNNKTQEFQKSIDQAKREVEVHLLSIFAEDFVKFENQIEIKKQAVITKKKTIEDLKQQISTLEKDVRNSQIPANQINKDIAFIMGRSELVFTNTELGYQITRNGKRAKNLSKGEENAIALIYFFNALQDVGVDTSNTIVVLDDPISSFDSNFYYNAISYIREKTLSVGQVFIFTHKYSLLKDFSKMFKEHTHRYTIQRINNAPTLKNEDALISEYHDEYAFLFKKIYYFVKKQPCDISEYLQYPNIARRVLEGFLTFKLPSSSTLMDKVLELEKGESTAAGRSILRLLNNHSHLRVISTNDLTDDIDSIEVLPDVLNHLMEFIKFHDKRHYDTLAALCDPDYNSEGSAVEIVRAPKRTVKFFRMSASAGPGDFMDEDPTAEPLEVDNQECTCAIKISGDSMEPDIHDGDIILLKNCEEVRNAHMGIVSYRGKCYCKKLVKKDDGLLLVSSNKAYKPIPVTSFDEYHLFGEVVGIIHADELPMN